MSICLAIHGGAGTLRQSDLTEAIAAARHEGLRQALRRGFALLRQGGSALDAVTEAVMELEDDPQFNAGHGAVLTDHATLEMDAALMSGADRRAGAVAGICGPRNPILAARAVLDLAGPVLMIGEPALNIARAANLPFEPAAYFLTDSRVAALQRELARRASGAPDTRSDADRHGTVGAVARDHAGHLAAATSTGGLTAKRAGRVGDTPIFGAGTFADDATCAVSCTGTGEVFIRYTAAADIAARIRYRGDSLATAAHDIITELSQHGGDGGLIALGPTGAPELVFNCSGMYRGFVTEDGTLHTAIHREAFCVAAL
ncbi:MAG TPA: isoaspartyl peptidase/L-asparaginase [Acidiphilium sp.]|nr:MAG: beta-aspartyl-peptidase [Acidiphilium sp. 21-60-14]OYV91171.1 MAG: beta-aspartyl-peptidase [Acidiphilium sp. 37-60-79]OZB39883.1 MAG: beta-aspartyl-peptidase [Acidiphilium sp. 34-60-192]HQT87052.1 isoaspartyl peptidase/L-asparaginase [Acidiphilium sp.]HQU22901.1 isoaspartyl peptidase/L-asparaginase [Acidiphilium sp.]